MFVAGDNVRCIESRTFWGTFANGSHLPGLAYRKKMTVTQTREFNDGSQQIWVRYRKGTPVGPYLSTRFIPLEKERPVYEYRPDQQGDTDEDI